MTRLIFLLLFGCGVTLPAQMTTPTPTNVSALNEATAIWLDAGLPWSDRCDRELPRIRVAIMDRAEICRWYEVKCKPENAPLGVFRIVASVPLILLRADIPDRHHRLIMHEATHWLGVCAGIGVDTWHRDAVRWQWEGGR